MKKVFVNCALSDSQKERLQKVSNEYELVYEPEEDVEVIIGNYAPNKMRDFTNLKWFQASAVGVDNYMKRGILADEVVMTNAVDIHSLEVAQHTFALVISMLKNLHLYRDNQSESSWKDEGKVKDFKKTKVAIIGFGDIGKQLAELLKGIGMYVVGVKRTMIEKPSYLDELYTNDELHKAISDVDVVVSILPGTKETYHLFDKETFEAMKKDAILINVGRGTLYDEEVLKEVLENGTIKAAAADVFAVEPLSEDSPLWKLKNFVVTPHVAGFFHVDSALDSFVDLVEENLRHYINGEELKYVVSERTD